MDEEKLKKAFSRIKQDIFNLNSELKETKDLIKKLYDEFNTQKMRNLAENQLKSVKKDTSTVRQITSTHPITSTDTSTVRQEIEGLKSPNLSISIGNQGASTDRQTDRQTDTSTHIYPKIKEKTLTTNIEADIQEASEILDSLDNLKKQIRLKFKKVTDQEMMVFSTIYQLEEQNPTDANYSKIAFKLNLSESSIRDYVQRMVNKGIPIKKHKINNKKIILSISSELKKIATLSTIFKLREL